MRGKGRRNKKAVPAPSDVLSFTKRCQSNKYTCVQFRNKKGKGGSLLHISTKAWGGEENAGAHQEHMENLNRNQTENAEKNNVADG